MARNEAAERLRDYARRTWRTDTIKGRHHGEDIPQSKFLADLDAALAAERAATVLRIRAWIVTRLRLVDPSVDQTAIGTGRRSVLEQLIRILDSEAAR